MLIRRAGEVERLPAVGPVLVSVGMEPRRDLVDACRDLTPRLGVHVVGDASGDGGSVHAANETVTAAVRAIVDAAQRASD